MMLLLATASAAPTSALINETIQQSSGKPSPEQSVINPVAVIEDTKKKLVATSEELALLPSEAVAGSSATGSSGEVVNIFARRLHLRQLVFLYQGQLTRLASLQVRQQHRLELESQAANWSGFSEPSLHPFLRADELKESVTELGSRVDELESWISALDQAGAQVINIAENSTVKLWVLLLVVLLLSVIIYYWEKCRRQGLHENK
jgi:hypothetical protein